MPDDATTVWTVPVSKQTDENLRLFLAEHGMAGDDLPKFVEDAVKWRVLDRTIAEVRAKFADLTADQLEELIEEAVASARHEGARPAG